jgi:hypothetical protein
MMLFMVIAFLGFQAGCTDPQTTGSPSFSEVTTIKEDVYGGVAGNVSDIYTNQPLANVTVTLEGIRQNYTVTTDRNGHFRINSVYLGTVSGITGGAPATSDEEEVHVVEEFPLFFYMDANRDAKPDYTPWREIVDLEYTYRINNGVIVVDSGTFFEVGRTVLMPFVQSFSGTVWAGSEPAVGTLVMLAHTGWPRNTQWEENIGSDYVELVNSFALTDETGTFTFDIDDRVVAYGAGGEYELIVYPYDVVTAGCTLDCT